MIGRIDYLVGGTLPGEGAASQMLKHAVGSRPCGQAGSEDEELVAPNAGHNILLAHDLRQEDGQLFQDVIALGVPVGVVHGLEIVHIDDDEHARTAFGAQRRLDAIEGGGAVVQPREAVALGLAPKLTLAQSRLTRVQQTSDMAHRAALLVVENHRLVAVPHRFPVGTGRRGFEIDKRVFADLCHERREIMGGDGQLARLLAAAVHHEIPLLGSAAETTFEVAVHMGFARAALDIEEHIVGERRENLKPLIRPAQLLPLAHALGRVH